ncbi:MAG: glycogen debranching protein GlgX [Actinobacteria bacterium]|nr:MAG: glycogen debranching protein GlgX [Actinomycetota bacterium]
MTDTVEATRPSATVTGPYQVEAGRAHPLGAEPDAEGVNFSVYTEGATAVTLLVFAEHDSPQPVQVVELDPNANRSFHFWHVYLRGLRPGAHYAYRVAGPHDPHDNGYRFDPDKVLIDPYARGVTKALWDRGAACVPGDNLATSMRATVIDVDDYDWEGDRPLNRPMHETVIYEMHVGGFTRSPSSGVYNPGTYRGVVEKIPYLKSLGVTAVELLPVFMFDEREGDRILPEGTTLTNYWGYSPLALFAPHDGYCVSATEGTHVREFRDMVKALHAAGIEVILDVVFNHTGEGNHLGPAVSFKGMANPVYYHLSPSDGQYYMDYSGCGNTFNCNHPIVEKLIVECLEYWVREMHVDGFRFDEGSILSRAPDGAPMAYPPVPWHIELTEELADTKIISEPWDAAGLYEVGYAPGYRWAQWNDRFRDDVRRFVRGDRGLAGVLASRLAGSSDIYQAGGRLPINSINFVTAHDGFTLNDLVSYNGKHNEANGEGNRDGNDNNLSWNCGAEGPTADAAVEQLRERQIRNFATILMLSQGVPMIVAGDEVRRTQQGNNNAYCHDSELNWFDWRLVGANAGLLRFFSRLIGNRRRHAELHRARFFTGEVNERGLADISWHGCNLHEPGFDDPTTGVLAFTLGGADEGTDLHAMLNMEDTALDFELPSIEGRRWYRSVDTALEAPDDITDPGAEVPVEGATYRVDAHSVVVLFSRTT